MKLKHNIIILLLFAATSVQAQQLLSLQDAVQIALQNNFDIQLAKNDADIAAVNNTLGNAGMLPRVNLNFSDNFSNTTINQKYTSGLELKQSGVHSSNLTGSVAFSWTLFDGMRMFVTHRKLMELQNLGYLNFKEQVQQSVADLMKAYYDMVRQKMQVEATQKSLELVGKRLEIARKKKEVGSISAYEMNQSVIDETAIRSLLKQQQNQLRNAKLAFNILLGRDGTTDFDVPQDIDIKMDAQLVKDELQNSMTRQNYALQAADKLLKIGELSIKEVRAQRLPVISFNSAYNLTQQRSTAGFSLLNQSSGLTYGISATMPIFNGFNIRTLERTAILQLSGVRINVNQLKTSLNYSLLKALNDYETFNDIAKMENDNIKLVDETVKIAGDRYASGLSTLVEVKEAEKSLQDAYVRQITAEYNLKVAEIEILRLKGELVK